MVFISTKHNSWKLQSDPGNLKLSELKGIANAIGIWQFSIGENEAGLF